MENLTTNEKKVFAETQNYWFFKFDRFINNFFWFFLNDFFEILIWSQIKFWKSETWKLTNWNAIINRHPSFNPFKEE